MADTKLSALSSGSAIADADLSYWAQGGASVKQAASAIWTYIQTKFGTGVATALGVNVGSAGAVVVNGGALGTPSGGSAANLTAASSTVLGPVKPDGTTITNAAGAISVTYGTSANSAAQGNDSRITGAVQSGGALGTPSSGNLANTTGYPASALPVQVPQTLGQSHIPFVLLSSGTMGNNGAISLLSGAVATAYPNAYVYLPAGAIAAGSAAGWYYAVFSSTTALTVYNNTYTSGTPAIPGTPTAFSTTGPGAYVQTTGSSIAAYTLAIAGNVIGANGSLYTTGVRTFNNSAGAKTITLNYGAFAFGAAGGTTALDQAFLGGISNRGVTNVQVPLGQANMGLAASGSALLFGSVDSTSAQNLVVNLQLATATDTMTLENIIVQLIPGVP